MGAKNRDTVGEVIALLHDKEAWRIQAAKAESKVTGPPELYTLNCHYALRATECEQESLAVGAKLQAIPGYDRLRALCEAEGARVSSDRVKQLRGKLCLKRSLSIDTVDQMELEQFVRAVLAMEGAPSEKAADQVLNVTNWSDLAIGIEADRTYWAVVPAPAIRETFLKSKAIQLKLPGERWKAVLTALAESPDPMQVPRHELLRRLKLLPPPSEIRRDPRADRRVEEQALQSDFPGRESSANQLNEILSDLRRKLRKLVKGPKGKGNSCLLVEGDHVVGGFLVRHLLSKPGNQKSFG
jgi:hypothetical protein